MERTRLARIVEWSVAGILTLVIVFAHVRVLQHAGPLWRDEISSLRVATMPTFSAFWAALIYDPFPALFFALLHFWEWSGMGLRPIDDTNEAYKLGVNYVIYGLTH